MPVLLDQGRGLVVVNGEPITDRVGLVVLAALVPTPCEESAQDLVLVYIEAYDGVKPRSLLPEEFI